MPQLDGRWSDALFQQTEQLRFLESELGMRFMLSFQDDFEAKRSSLEPLPRGGMYRAVRETVRRADPVYVSSDVTEIIDVAFKTFQPEVVLPTDPFVTSGFAYFPRSIELRDRRGNLTAVRALAWLPISVNNEAAPFPAQQTGVYMVWFSHIDDPSGPSERPLREQIFERGVTPPPHSALQLLHACVIPFHKEAWRDLDEEAAGIEFSDSIRQMWTLPQVMWRIGQQLVPERERPPRATRRDAARHGLEREDVSVLRLRRTRYRYDEEGQGRDHDHRWMVRGHWRNQWYPSLDLHRQVWINPYVKGPDDKPLVIKPRVVEFVR